MVSVYVGLCLCTSENQPLEGLCVNEKSKQGPSKQRGKNGPNKN